MIGDLSIHSILMGEVAWSADEQGEGRDAFREESAHMFNRAKLAH
jgi:hypothetical protein